jgi:hypothetical protein
MPKGPNWYPARDMRSAIAEISPYLARFTGSLYTGSRWALYAALKYSKALGATHVLAFSPQYSIDPTDVGSVDRRFLSSFRSELHQGMAIKAGDVQGDVYIFYDPYDVEDRFHVSLIRQAAPSVREIRVPERLISRLFCSEAQPQCLN